jgi:hypothetical protein
MKQTDAVGPPNVANLERHRRLPLAWNVNREIRPVPRRARGAAMSRADTLATMPSIRSDRAVPRSLGLLIEVPEVMRRPTRHRRRRVVGHWQSRQPSHERPKRRLRREVRIAGCALLALAPLLSVGTLGWSGRPPRVLACSIAEATAPDQGADRSALPRDPASRLGAVPADSTGVVVLSVEPASLAPGADTEVPVIFPGYVLPDDSLEDSTHEGS